MRRAVSLITTMLLAVVLLTSAVDTGIAEPQKNQIPLPVTCHTGDQRLEFTLIFNGEGQAGQVEFGGSNNIIPKSYLVIFSNPETGVELARDEFRQGNIARQKDLIDCTGQVTTDISGLGPVRADFDFRGLVTPRSK